MYSIKCFKYCTNCLYPLMNAISAYEIKNVFLLGFFYKWLDFCEINSIFASRFSGNSNCSILIKLNYLWIL
jgi:hypothetical protein